MYHGVRVRQHSPPPLAQCGASQYSMHGVVLCHSLTVLHKPCPPLAHSPPLDQFIANLSSMLQACSQCSGCYCMRGQLVQSAAKAEEPVQTCCEHILHVCLLHHLAPSIKVSAEANATHASRVSE